jgi:hypothetical protein
MVPENKQNRRYKQINFIGLQNIRPQAPDQGSIVGGLLSVSPPEEHHARRKFCRRGGNPRTCDSGSAIDS